MITICVEDQIRRGFVKPENKNRHIRSRLLGSGLIKPMKKAECQKWYDEVMKGGAGDEG